ncbi:MAG: hypothetical protein KC910_05870 [Candidatus Eremiobacteraeota bacterium]|nr:hypothetical protein [Candidatus Eremiobacteraeota bacterium]
MSEHDDILRVITTDPAIDHYLARVDAGEVPLHQSFVDALHQALEHHFRNPEVPRKLLCAPPSGPFLREMFRETMLDLTIVTWTELEPKQRVNSFLMLKARWD